MSYLTVRKLVIDLDNIPVPIQWAGGDAYRTQVFNAMSMTFPIGEKFFIDSVAAGAAAFTLPDPLREDVKHFIGQEAEHSHLHRRFNRNLEAHGLRFVIGPFIKWRVRQSENFHPLNKLAVTMAYEHFTAVQGDALLADGDCDGGGWLNGVGEPMRTLWLWHAAEESEHRAVAFDVYRAGGGGYWRRVLWMLYISLLFVAEVQVQVLHNLYRTGALWRWRTGVEALHFLFGRRGVIARTLPRWLKYFAPGFHPGAGVTMLATYQTLDKIKPWLAQPEPLGKSADSRYR